MTRPPMLAADHIRELTQGFTTTEHIRQPTQHPDGRWRTTTRLHHVTHRPLLDQINDTVTGSTMGGEVFRAAYGSKPAGRMDALAFLERIQRQARQLATDHGVTEARFMIINPGTRVPNPTTNPGRYPRWTYTRLPFPQYPLLSALAGVLGDRQVHTVKAWWATARVLSQHDGPPMAPDVPCPEEACERWGSIRARLDERVAVCVECHHVWSDEDGTFGRLAIWSQWSAEHLRGPRHLVDADLHGYPGGLGYRVVCPECEVERAAMTVRGVVRAALAKKVKAGGAGVPSERIAS